MFPRGFLKMSFPEDSLAFKNDGSVEAAAIEDKFLRTDLRFMTKLFEF